MYPLILPFEVTTRLQPVFLHLNCIFCPQKDLYAADVIQIQLTKHQDEVNCVHHMSQYLSTYKAYCIYKKSLTIVLVVAWM